MPLVQKPFGDIITFTRASTATYFDATGTLQSAAIDAPRFDYDPATLAARGFLIEEQRTNSIRNNTMQGAVAGTPGTLPTNWSVAAAAGLTTNVIGTGVSNGITWIDLQVTGTTTSTSYILVPEDITQIAALNGQTWAMSAWWSIVGGTFTNVTDYFINLRESNSGGTQLTSGQVIVAPPTATFARFTATRTLNQATTAFIQPRFQFLMTNGAAVDFTLRIGLPQVELGAFATSVIPTTTTALTRSADVASVNTLSPWFNASEGTIYAEWSRNAIVPNAVFPRPFNLINTATTDNLAIAHVGNQTSTTSQSIYTLGLSWPFSSVTANPTLGVKAAVAVQAGSGRYAVNGTLGGSDYAAPSIPVFNQLNLGGGKGFFANNQLNGWLRRVTYYPRRLSNAELQSITA